MSVIRDDSISLNVKQPYKTEPEIDGNEGIVKCIDDVYPPKQFLTTADWIRDVNQRLAAIEKRLSEM